ncbi:hypothetical protein [Massilia antarctica]|uniref:hypothetical protein n=1 Tax=Massilia antarctica TaxID=2765360 RepID=UPI002270D605|nr:hypothetical protein [Massilia sp. H27-R4]MCY0915453.1 hypothetical protein [Massilia sp. H27-R4]
MATTTATATAPAPAAIMFELQWNGYGKLCNSGMTGYAPKRKFRQRLARVHAWEIQLRIGAERLYYFCFGINMEKADLSDKITKFISGWWRRKKSIVRQRGI